MGGATPQKGHTQLGFVHEAASVGLSTRGLMRIWAHTCVGMPVGLYAHLVNTEANLLQHRNMCDWPEVHKYAGICVYL